jgi:hypothetical protein
MLIPKGFSAMSLGREFFAVATNIFDGKLHQPNELSDGLRRHSASELFAG